tara:strand:- start:40 stop:231 length:192 start_codon:yes stop_codon:yes gene_type:complete
MNSEVDVNVLINHYHKRISTLINQNILLEAKLESLTKDYTELESQIKGLETVDKYQKDKNFDE